MFYPQVFECCFCNAIFIKIRHQMYNMKLSNMLNIFQVALSKADGSLRRTCSTRVWRRVNSTAPVGLLHRLSWTIKYRATWCCRLSYVRACRLIPYDRWKAWVLEKADISSIGWRRQGSLEVEADKKINNSVLFVCVFWTITENITCDCKTKIIMLYSKWQYTKHRFSVSEIRNRKIQSIVKPVKTRWNIYSSVVY
jgi:hypothetical protein